MNTGYLSKPEGGFCFIHAEALVTAWWAYRRGVIRFMDLRAWLASFEVVARRCVVRESVRPAFRLDEVTELVGGRGGEHTRASVRRLAAAGLIHWTQSEVVQLKHAAEFLAESGSGLEATLRLVPNWSRRVPVPRRVLRLLAACGRPVVVATTLGHLLRCVYYRKGGVRPDGLCKASWVASVFEVDERNVKGARSYLCRLGILERSPAPQRVLNRHGGLVRLNLQWGGARLAGRRRSPPLGRRTATGSPPPRETGNSSLRRSENQKPGAPGPAGVRKRTSEEPRLSRVTLADLRDPSRLLALWREAGRAGLVGGSESERLKLFAAAEHAKAHGRTNPPGLFVSILRRGLWRHLTLHDEDAARRSMARCAPPATSERSSASRSAASTGDDSPVAIRELVARSLACARASDVLTRPGSRGVRVPRR